MSLIRSRKKSTLLTSSMVAMAGSLAMPVVQAQDAPVLNEVKVQATAESSYKAEKSASPKLTQPLVDTPKTVQVLKKEMLQEQGAASLMEALRNTSGITMQLGENGNTAAGDTFQMRGFSANTSTFVDGVRDLGAVTRDVFNLEQVEVVKGAGGSDIGRGASAGYINLISKLPTLEEAATATATVGTANKQRYTADINRKIDDSSAFRVNLMQQKSGVDGRDNVENNSVGIAPSLALGLGTSTRVYVYGQHVTQDNVPDGGIPTIGMDGYYANPVYNHDNDSAVAATATTPAKPATPTRRTAEGDALAAAYQNAAKVDRHNFYGSAWDREKVTADMLSIKVEHDLAKDTVLSNITRYGKSDLERIITGINGPALNTTSVGTYTDKLNATGFKAGTDNPNNSATWTVNRSVQGIDQVNEVLANVTNLLTKLSIAGMQHDLSLGLELAKESEFRGTLAGGSAPAAKLYNPYQYDAFVAPKPTGAFTDGSTDTVAVYVFDTINLNDNLKVNVGVRADRYKLNTEVGTVVTTANLATYSPLGYKVGDVGVIELEDSDTLLSWNVGAVFKPASNGSIYVAFANAQTPPGSANFTLSSTVGNQANADLDPQKTTTAEIGTKWELLNKRLNVSVAVYRTENDGQTTTDAFGVVTQDAKTRVDGLELAAVGQLTNFWQLTASIGFMEAEQLDSRTQAGVFTDSVRWTPDVTASVWTSYTLDKLTVGGGARYMGEQKRVITQGTDLSTQNMPVIDAYMVADIMAAYKVSKNTNLRLNVYNVFDEEYINTLNNSGARATLGAPISAAITAEFSF